MQTEQENNRPDLFELLAKWANLLPKEGEYSQTSVANLYKVGNEIQQLCSEVEKNGGGSITTPRLTATSDVKKEPEAASNKSETDFKPSFIFQLSSDDILNPSQEQFDCVYDFCQKLKTYCETSTKHHLDIEKDWLKLLLACSSHNYERFMWIHLTFQSANQLKLNWNQVQKRLQCKFDEPSRHTMVKNQIDAWKYIPELESIDVANAKFSRLADELHTDVMDAYLNGLPTAIKDVIMSTIAYDHTTAFVCTLEDIQQRATVFLSAGEGDFIFYSKSAHVALKLEHEKVNKKDCEFHILAEHSTSTCPDYSIVKYPYMEFTAMAGVPPISRASISPSVVPMITDSANQQASPIVVPVETLSSPVVEFPTVPQLLPFPVQPLALSSPPVLALPAPPPAQPQALPSLVVEQSPALGFIGLVGQTQTEKPNVPVVTAPMQEPPAAIVKQEPMSTTSQIINGPAASQAQPQVQQQTDQPPVEDIATRLIAEAIAAANQVKQQTAEEKEIAAMSALQVVERAKQLSESGKPLPEALKLRVVALKTQILQQNSNNNSPQAKKPRSISPPRHSRRRSASPRRRRSPSPRRRRGRSRSRSRSRSPSEEIGCYIHGVNATHTTQDCRQAQMVIPSRRSRSPSPPRRGKGKGTSLKKNGEENICIFCGLPFKPGHLGYCKEVRSKKKSSSRRR